MEDWMFAVIEIPDFELQSVLRIEPEMISRPVALIDAALSKPVIVQLTDAARTAGVTAGMTATQAMARCRHVVLKSRSPAQENAAGDVLLQCAFSFSPTVEATAPGLCTIGLKGLKNVTDETFGRKIVQSLEPFHLQGRIGIAENPTLARHAAREARPLCVVCSGATFLSELPIAALAPSPSVASILQKWGIKTVGAFVGLGKSAVAERLGSEALDLFECAMANSVRPLRLVRPPESFVEEIDFEEPVEVLEPLLFLLRRFLEQISGRLDLGGWVAESIHLRLMFSDGAAYEHQFQIPSPTLQVETLFRMLHTHLENMRTEHPITGLRLSAIPCRARSQQFSLFEMALRDPNHFCETLARLTGLLGADRVGTPEAIASHRPDAFRNLPVNLNAPGNSESLRRLVPGLSLRRFRPALAVDVQIEDERPSQLRGAHASGRIVQAEGPWRSSGDWWDGQSWDREDWDVQAANGALYRIYQQNEKWFVEGMYD
jgi:protein ImuB